VDRELAGLNVLLDASVLHEAFEEFDTLARHRHPIDDVAADCVEDQVMLMDRSTWWARTVW